MLFYDPQNIGESKGPNTKIPATNLPYFLNLFSLNSLKWVISEDISIFSYQNICRTININAVVNEQYHIGISQYPEERKKEGAV